MLVLAYVRAIKESDEYIEVFAAEFSINTDLHHKDEHRGLVWNGPELVHVQVNV
ncbi:hypothetical protein [Pseudoalteromonas sp. MMG005]|uniref:hypothetical protein n=1 Tax=Pseudoalteromonas sp. MMG005 TaxID=2822682 RepID=UPI001B3A3944|nr:hypothetical protein [Pseudoalteromonas sp. MMG005]MBQ4846199.1 hypothetical protein [Pseudoalteromonas sp. MMG005]